MRVLIIGSKGMLGRTLVAEFKSGNDVIAWDREDVDITKVESLELKVKSLIPDLVINSAAYTDVDGAENNLETANKINGFAVGYLAKTCKDLGTPLVHFSTEYVFDGEKREGYKEDDGPRPISVYGHSKYLGEQELQKNTDKFYLIRLSRLFGGTHPPPSPRLRWTGNPLFEKERGSPLFAKEGQGGVPRKKSFVQQMLELAKTKTELDVVDEEVSLPTYAPDLAKQVKYMLEKKLSFGIYHSPNSGQAVTWFGFAREIFKTAGINVKLNPVPADHFPRPAKRPKFVVLLNTKLPAMRDWREALAEFLNEANYK